ncbi:MAG TPA: hypothetical protein V6D17_21215 [Candidatus Obscuribacterales bacterium]
MNVNNESKSHPIRELQWLAYFFIQHGRADIAQEIFEQLADLRHRSADDLASSNEERGSSEEDSRASLGGALKKPDARDISTEVPLAPANLNPGLPQ